MIAKFTLALWTSAAVGLLAASPAAQEKPLTMEQLPAPVQATLKAQLDAGATLRSLSSENEHGVTEYEAEFLVNGTRRDLTVAPDGTIEETEDLVRLASIPAAAQAAIKQAGTVLSVEKVSHHGVVVAYEAEVQPASGRRKEVRVTPTGKPAPENQ